MLTVKELSLDLPLGKDLIQQGLILSRAGNADAGVLPVSTCSLELPGSPTRVSSFGNVSISSSIPSSTSIEGHLLAERNAFEEVCLQEAKEKKQQEAKQQESGILNEKLAKLLERRKSQGAEALKALKAEHATVLGNREALHKEELNMKDSAHRRIVVHMEEELQDLRQQLQAALNRWEAAEELAHRVGNELDVERKLRKMAEEDLRSLHRLLEAELQDG